MAAISAEGGGGSVTRRGQRAPADVIIFLVPPENGRVARLM